MRGHPERGLLRKLQKLRDWLNLTEAADHLSLLFDEPIVPADLLRLAVDGQLTLSVHLVNNAHARIGPAVTMAEARQTEFDFFGEVFRRPEGLQLNDDWVIELSEEVVPITGVWDLPMFGAEKLDIEHHYQFLTGGPPVSLVSMTGALLCGNGVFCQVQDHFSNNEYFAGTLKEPWGHPENFFPAGVLPRDAVLVVRPESLGDLITRVRLAQDQEGPEQITAPDLDAGPAVEEATKPTPGRRMSERWPDWVAELADYLHENGIPPGTGAAGQEVVIAAIENRLAERGLEAPSRTTVQETVRKVLGRLREAGN